MKTTLSAFLLFGFFMAVFFTQSPKDPRRAIASITFYKNGEVYVQGTGWFLGSPRQFVTVKHVVCDSLSLSGDWAKATLCMNVDDVLREMEFRIRWTKTIELDSEDIAVLELSEPFPGAQILNLRNTPLPKESKIRGWGYKNRLKPNYGEGQFYNMVPNGFGYFRLENASDHLPFDCGTSGSPLLDENGDVVAMVSKVKRADVHPYILDLLFSGMPDKNDWTNLAAMTSVQK